MNKFLRRSGPSLALRHAALPVLLVVAACGGGGSSPPAGESSQLVLSADNHQRVGQEALSAGLQLSESGDFVLGAQVQARNESSLVALAIGALQRTLASPAPVPAATGLIITAEHPCDNNGGRYRVAVNDADNNNRYDNGDSLTYTFFDCLLEGERADGSLVVAIKALTGNLASTTYSAELDFTMNNLALSGPTGSWTGSGVLAVRLNGAADGSGSSSVRSSDFSSVARSGGSSSTRRLTGFSLAEDFVRKGSDVEATLRFDGTMASSGLGNQQVTLATRSPFVTAAGALYPGTGQAVIAGSGGGTVRITVIDGTRVRFELDANGDGSYEVTTTKPWSELL